MDLKQKGYAIRKISRELGISRITVKRYLANPGKEKYHRTEPYPSKLDAYKEYILERLKEYPALSATKLYREIREKGYNGGKRIVMYYVGKNRPVNEKQVFLRYETLPGEQAQVDWSEFGTIDYYGRKCKLHCFSLVWGYSRRQYIEFTVSEDIYTLMRCHERAFEFFGGIPGKILYDNMKQVVELNTGERIEYNKKFYDFAMHYGFIPDACHVKQPQEKGKVERVIEYIRTGFFTGEVFNSLEELNAKASHWCSEVADKRVHGTTHEIPARRWEIERDAIGPLPEVNYDTGKVEHRLVQKDCYINYEGNCYSVPWQYARKTVVVKGTETKLSIYYADTGIAEHLLSMQKGKYIRNPEHLKGMPIVKDGRREKYRLAFNEIGEAGRKYFETVLSSSISNPYYHLSVVLKLKEVYPASEIVRAIESALKFNALQSKTVANLVRQKLPPYEMNCLEKALSVSGISFSKDVEERPLEFYDWVSGGRE